MLHKRLFAHFSPTTIVPILIWIGVTVGSIVSANLPTQKAGPTVQQDDTTRYGIKRTAPIDQKDLDQRMGDLRDPDNLKTEAEYNEKKDGYAIGTKIGDNYLNTPFLMSKDEYNQWSLRKSMRAYYRKKMPKSIRTVTRRLLILPICSLT